MNIRRCITVAIFACAAAQLTSAAGDPTRGAAAFRVCATCHSVEPGTNLTGPSLAHVWGTRAASAQGFHRYSEALQRSGIVWNEQSLERWLADPQALVRGTAMTFPGMRDARERADVVAYLRAVSEGHAPSPQRGGMMGGMAGMMGGSEPADLRHARAEDVVVTIDHCGDTYPIKTSDGKVRKFWEYNVRLKTDSSSIGPVSGRPVMTRSGMQGDRISIVFVSPKEIGESIRESCH
jgi:cytochrome c